MKTKVEIEGYEIEIEFVNGMISVKAEKDDEVVEEFSIEVEEGQGESEEGQDIQDFDKFGQDEEEDFESEDENEEEDDDFDSDEEENEEENGPMALESFQSFINKSNKKK